MRPSPQRLLRLMCAAALAIAAGAAWEGSRAHAASIDPALGWHTLHTPHFEIHYHDGFEALARRAASKLEIIHDVLSEELDWQPRRKTDVVMIDNTDLANGFAQTMPNNTITIFVTAPIEGSSLDLYEDWLTALLAHEYTHILHIDTIGGLPAVLRKIFGRLVMTGDVYPRWVVEGYAVFQETDKTQSGRARSAYTNMVLRMSTLEQGPMALGDAEGFQDDWPAGNIRYLWGGTFITWVIERYGREKWTEFTHVHASALNPLAYNVHARRVFGESIRSLWSQWQDDLALQYRAQEEQLRREGLREGEVLRPADGQISDPVFSPDGEWIYFAQGARTAAPGIWRIPTWGGLAEEVLSDKRPSGLALSPDGRTLYYSAVADVVKYNTWFDVFSWDLEERRLTRLTHSARARDPVVTPDGRGLLVTWSGAQQSSLAWVQPGGVLERLTPTEDFTQLGGAAFSPDGEQIVVSAWKEGGRRDLFLYDREGRSTARLTDDRAIDQDPCFSPDGRWVVFASDRDGIFNLYALQPGDTRLWRITRALGGAFQPAISPDGQRLTYVGYTSRGFDLRVMDFDPAQWEELPPLPPAYPELSPTPPLATSTLPGEQPPQSWGEPTPYRPGLDLLPRLLAPQFYLSETGAPVFGAFTFTTDPLRRISADAFANYRTDLDFLSWGAGVTWRRWQPELTVSASTQAVSLGPLLSYPLPSEGGTAFQGYFPMAYTYNEVRTQASATVTVPYQNRRSFFVRYGVECREPLEPVPGVDEAAWEPGPLGCPAPLPGEPAGYFEGGIPDRGSFAGISFGWRYRNVSAWPRSVSAEKGQTFGVTAQLQSRYLGGDYERQIVVVDWRTFHTAPWARWLGLNNHALALRLAGGAALGDELGQHAFRMGGSFGESPFVLVPDEYYPLRGYRVASDVGDRAVLAQAEYRFPLFYVYEGLGMWPLYARGTSLAIFTDAGHAFDPLHLEEGLVNPAAWQALLQGMRVGSGVELRADAVVGYGLAVDLRLGYAVGWQGGYVGDLDSLYVTLGSSF